MKPISPARARIGVVGAGPGGLTCARVLQQRGLEVTVVELDRSVSAHRAGSTLDMQLDTGQVALREAGLFEKYLSLARPEDQEGKMLNRHGEVVFSHVPEPGDLTQPEIDRAQLRRLLFESLEPGTVRFHRRVLRVEPAGSGHELVFADGEVEYFDLVIGADGAFSRIRRALSDVRPEYAGVTFIEAHFSNVDTDHRRISDIVGNGNTYARGDNRALLAQSNSDHHIRVFIGLRTPLDWFEQAGIDLNDTDAVRAHLLREFDGWDTGLLDMIRNNEGPYRNRPIWALPLPYGWDHIPGLTLIGDAAHVMSPFGGHGANLAMLDGADLAVRLSRSATIEEAVVRHESDCTSRANPRGEDAARGIDNFFQAGEVIEPPPVAARKKAMREGFAVREARGAGDSAQPDITATR
jgi:2-polyprenyl-6-methoxyphenol hydroxylase-like FAD-dependent oxidoreductase